MAVLKSAVCKTDKNIEEYSNTKNWEQEQQHKPMRWQEAWKYSAEISALYGLMYYA